MRAAGYSFQQLGSKLLQHHVLEHRCAILVVFLISLHKGPPINIADVRLPITPQKIETANILPKDVYDFGRHELLFDGQANRVSDLLSVLLPHNLPIEDWALSSFCMRKEFAYRVDLYVEAISLEKFFINVVLSVRADCVLIRIEGTALIANLPEKLLAASALIRVVVDVDVMVLSIERLFHEGLY